MLIPATLFFSKIAVDIWGLLYFCINCETFCSRTVKSTLGSLKGIALIL